MCSVRDLVMIILENNKNVFVVYDTLKNTFIYSALYNSCAQKKNKYKEILGSFKALLKHGQ